MGDNKTLDLLTQILRALRGSGGLMDATFSLTSLLGDTLSSSSVLENISRNGLAGGLSLTGAIAGSGEQPIPESVSRWIPGFASVAGGGLALPLQMIGRLFGSSDSESEATRSRPSMFERPPSVSINGGFIASDQSITAVDYDQSARPRALPPAVPTGPSIVVNVQAMDSKSFLDHSSDIARAVREALLNSHPLGDYLGGE